MPADRPLEFFGPDLGRGPFAAHNIETAVIQIATAVAQPRAPLTRSDADILAHGDFIRSLADRLAPDYAATVNLTVGVENANRIQSTIRTALATYSLLECWLADSTGGGETGTEPDNVTWNNGVVLETITPNKRYLIVTTSTGVADVTVEYSGAKVYRWAATRLGRVFYSNAMYFN